MRPKHDWQPKASELDFTHRVDPLTLPERMEQPCSYEELRGCLQELDRVNTWTFGFRPTRLFVRQIARRTYPQALRVLEVGFGSGTGLRLFGTWAARRRLRVRLTGIDLDPMAARAASEMDAAHNPTQNMEGAEGGIRWLIGNALTEPAAQGQDVVFSSLVTHHMRDAEIVAFLRWMEDTTSVGWFINDLRRSADAYRIFGVLARLLRWHPFVQSDGLISIRRAFRAEDWLRLLAEAGIPAGSVQIRGGAPGRLCLTRLH